MPGVYFRVPKPIETVAAHVAFWMECHIYCKSRQCFGKLVTACNRKFVF